MVILHRFLSAKEKYTFNKLVINLQAEDKICTVN